MLQPLLDDRTRLDLRARSRPATSAGAGRFPRVRVGRQPYGILPATAYSRLRLGGSGRRPTRSSALARRCSPWPARTGPASPRARARRRAVATRPTRSLLDVLGLQATSAEYCQRVRREPRRPVQPRQPRRLRPSACSRRWQAAVRTRAALASAGAPRRRRRASSPSCCAVFFFRAAQGLHGPLIDDQSALGDRGPRAVRRADGRELHRLAGRRSAQLARDGAARAAASRPRPRTRSCTCCSATPCCSVLGRRAASRGRRRRPRTAAARRAARPSPRSCTSPSGQGASESRFAPLYRADAGGSPGTTPSSSPTTCRPCSARTTRRGCWTSSSPRSTCCATSRRPGSSACSPSTWTSARTGSTRGSRGSCTSVSRRCARPGSGAQRSRLHVGAYGWLEEVRPKAGATSRSSSTPPRRRSSRLRALRPSYTTRRTAATCTRPR